LGVNYEGKTFTICLKALEKGVTDDVKEFMEGVCPAEFNGKSGKTIAEILRRLANEL
jgi:hypothetical protein